MPELPEVEYTARQLRATVIGATIHEVLVFWDRTIARPGLPEFLTEIAGQRIVNVRRRGKFLLLDLDGHLFLSIHRRMTGNFLLLPPGWVLDSALRGADPVVWSTKGPTFRKAQTSGDAPIGIQPTHCRVCFTFTDGRRLIFTDPRKFGRIALWPSEREMEVFAGLGPEPLGEDFTVVCLTEALAHRKTGIKQVLLAQDVVAGIGNIYADEALFAASIHPLRRADSLTSAEIALLHAGIIAVLKTGIEHGGTSFNDYRDLWGEAGNNYNHVQVYQQDGKPCHRCNTTIERVVIAQRSAHFCPTCQSLLTSG